MRFSHVANVLILLTAVATLTGCNNAGSGMPMPMGMPSPLQVAGNYSGSNTDSMRGHGTVNVNIVQAGTSLSGLWTFTYPASPNAATSFTGMLSAKALTINIAATSFSPCAYSITGTVNGKQISGTYTSSNCGNSGSFSISRP